MSDVYIFVGLLGVTGAAIFFVGNLFALITTFGLNKKVGIASLFVPFLPAVFCLAHRDKASYPLRLMTIGFALISCAMIIYVYLAHD